MSENSGSVVSERSRGIAPGRTQWVCDGDFGRLWYCWTGGACDIIVTALLNGFEMKDRTINAVWRWMKLSI